MYILYYILLYDYTFIPVYCKIIVQDVETLGIKKGYTIEKNNFHNISLGQGQEKLAEDAIELSARMGNWVMLQVNINLYLRSI